MATTYILKCVDNRYYVGSCQNISKRLSDHQRGKCKFTKSRLPVKLIYFKEYDSASGARQREYKIKSWKSRTGIEKLIKSATMARSANG